MVPGPGNKHFGDVIPWDREPKDKPFRRQNLQVLMPKLPATDEFRPLMSTIWGSPWKWPGKRRQALFWLRR